MNDNQTNPLPPTDSQQDNTLKNVSEQTITIEILRHRQIFNILRNPVALWKFIGLLMVVVVLLFFILATVSLIIKRYYPYNDITTNIYGATTFKNEDKDVTYWLFNTAEMWANSGIRVQENDILTIRTSGSWHTAIHHLVEDSKSNSLLRECWIGSDGSLRDSPNDSFRSQFRISPNDIDGVLLMTVFPENSQNEHHIMNNGNIKDNNKAFMDAISSDYQKYRIGRERRNIRIMSDGILHFTVNDVILTRKTIKKMYSRYIAEELEPILKGADKDAVNTWVNNWDLNDTIVFKENIRQIDKSISYAENPDSAKSKKDNPLRIKFGSYPGQKSKSLLDNELIYYYNNQFYDAWFVDNIGSALIIIEQKHQNQ